MTYLWPLSALLMVVGCVSATDIQKLCRSAEASKSCGQCIKQHTECAWCLDPHSTSAFRCDYVKAFEGKCNAKLIYSPKTELKIAPQHNLPLGSKHADGSTVIQIEPQQVVLRMKPGDIVEVPFKYLHKAHANLKDFVIQTSEFRSLGIGIEFSIICHGNRVQGRQCTDIRDGEMIDFYAKVSLNECRAAGDVAISIGAYGYHTVSAMFITPMCGCDCEKVQNQERRSPLCYGFGNLICGVCECQTGKGGNNCECDLNQYGVRTATELENKCRRSPNEAVCSGNGKCRCGRCQCDSEFTTGEFCDCEGSSCPKFDGKLCAGQGECSCGECRCEEGFAGDDCSCNLDTTPCVEGGMMCNGHGSCECGKCICNAGYTGITCGISSKEEVVDTGEELEEDEQDVDKDAESLEGQMEAAEESVAGEQDRDEPVNEDGQTDHSQMGSSDVASEGEPLSPVEDEEPGAPAEEGTVEAIQEGHSSGALQISAFFVGCFIVVIARFL
uniref:Integrin beta-like protein n=1 Tax=Ascaris suum TaxID=6253 RepID=F1L453_ASCSU